MEDPKRREPPERWGPRNSFLDQAVKDVPIDRGEEAPDVEVGIPDPPGVVLRCPLDELPKPLEGRVRALPLAAREAVVDEEPLEDGLEPFHEEVVDHPIAKVAAMISRSFGVVARKQTERLGS